MSLADWMPKPLLLMGPGNLAIWQWLGLVVVVLASWMVGRMGAALVIWIASKAAGQTETTLDDDLVARLRSPLRALASIALARAAVLVLELPTRVQHIVGSTLLFLFALTLVWGALRAIEVTASHMSRSRWAVARPSSRQLLSLVSRVAKVIVVVFATIGFLGALGLPVASLLAGLGIGGIALAFGAQKTVENVFGAVAIGVDQPFREGDFVKVEDHVMGTIESVGLRSTRLRTLDRTIVTLPNGRISDMRVETFAQRDRIRFTSILNLVYETSATQMREVLAGIERVLREHPGIYRDDIVVRLLQFAASSLDVEVIAYFTTVDMTQFRAWRQEILLGFMDVVEKAKTSFAYPTRTVHVVGDAKAARR